MTPQAVKIARRASARKLAYRSSLFDDGKVADVNDPEKFILRLNTLVFSWRLRAEDTAPTADAQAISANGKLKAEAELIVFGKSLLIDRPASLFATSGKPPNGREILQCVAVCMVELHERTRKKLSPGKSPGRSTRNSEITEQDLVRRWPDLFDETKTRAWVNSRLRSMKRLLIAYLKLIANGDVEYDGKGVKTSPEIKNVLDAISGNHAPNSDEPKPRRAQSSSAQPPSAADLAPFEIELGYSTPEEQLECRGQKLENRPATTLEYKCIEPVPKSGSGNIHAARKDRIILEPQVPVRARYKTNALIDRLALLVNTTQPTTREALDKAIMDRTGAHVQAQDVTLFDPSTSWGAPLPNLDWSKLTGFHFAIMIQDPTPDLLPRILDTIRDTAGIEKPTGLHLIEVSVDFYPVTSATPEEAMIWRERMVGALQRHHWAPSELFIEHERTTPRYVDARQFYSVGKGTDVKTRYLCAHMDKSPSQSDSRIDQPDIRERILGANAGNELYLNATLAKGGKASSYHVTIQHKVADNRNPKKNTKTVLKDEKRRARVEIAISGTEELRERHLATINDLAEVSFRKLTKPFLSFRLGTVKREVQHLQDGKAQSKTRGVYGLALHERARTEADRCRPRKRGEKRPRNQDREDLGLVSWPEMNDVVGDALDELQRRWRDFSWN